MLERLKKQKNSIAVALVAFLVSLLVCTSIFLPKNIGNILTLSTLPVEKLAISQIESQSSCSLERSGKYTITGEDPKIIFSCTRRAIEGLRINIEAQQAQNINFTIFTAYEDGVFSDDRSYSDTIFAGQVDAVIDLPMGEYSFIRIDIDTDGVYFKGIEVFDKQPDAVPFVPDRSLGDYLKAYLIPLVIAWIAWNIEKRTNALQTVIKTIKKNKFKIAEFIVFSVVAILAAVTIEAIIGLILSGSGWNRYRCAFLVGVAELIYVFIFTKKALKQKPENVFLPIALVIGLVLIFVSPIANLSWDLDAQYTRAVDMSYIDKVYASAAEQEISTNIDSDLLKIDKNEAGEIIWNQELYRTRLARLEEMDNLVAGERKASFAIEYLPSGIFMAVARSFDTSFATRYNLGRLANLLVYVFVCYFAIKKIKSGKMLLTVFALLPTNLFMATNYGSGSWITAFSMLGIAYYASIMQQPKRILSTRDVVIMSSAFALAVLPDASYVLLLITPLFMIKEWGDQREKKEYRNIIVTTISLFFLYLLIITLTKTGGADLLRGVMNETKLQIDTLLKHPISFAKMMGKFLWNYLSPIKIKSYISSFAILGTGKLTLLFVALIGFTALTDTGETIKFKIPRAIKLVWALAFIGSCIVIAIGLQTNVALLETIQISEQHYRYIIPVLAPVLLMVTGSRFNIIKNKKKYNAAILYTMPMMVMLEIYLVIITKMI